MNTFRIFIAIVFVWLTSCSAPPAGKEQPDKKTGDSSASKVIRTDTLTSSPEISADTIISARLLRFASFLDSSGYLFDTNRIKKTYVRLLTGRRLWRSTYLFFGLPIEKTALDFYLRTVARKEDLDEKYKINIEPFQKTKVIVSYFFTQKIPENNSGEKLFIDGVIEEWEFPDSASAKNAANELGRAAEYIYFNVGGFVSYKDNYMYVITSRATAFMYSIKPFFRRFATENAVTITNKIKWF